MIDYLVARLRIESKSVNNMAFSIDDLLLLSTTWDGNKQKVSTIFTKGVNNILTGRLGLII